MWLKDTLKAVLSEGQSPVVAGLALCAASAHHLVCVLLSGWSDTEKQTRRSKQILTTNNTFVAHILNQEMKTAQSNDQ